MPAPSKLISTTSRAYISGCTAVTGDHVLIADLKQLLTDLCDAIDTLNDRVYALEHP